MMNPILIYMKANILFHNKLEIEIDNEDYNYIDLLAIVQVIKFDSYDDELKHKKQRKKGV